MSYEPPSFSLEAIASLQKEELDPFRFGYDMSYEPPSFSLEATASLQKEELDLFRFIYDLITKAKAVFFDHDDTMVGTMKAKWAQHRYIASNFYGIELTDAELRAHWGEPLTLLVQSLYQTDEVESAIAHNIATRDQFPKILFEDTIDILKFLHSMGKKLGVVTATTRSSLQNDFRTLGIPEELFHYIQTEEDTNYHKPDPRVFEPALEWLAVQGIQPSEVVYIGDHLKDLKAARGVSFRFIGVETGMISRAEFRQEQVPSIPRLSFLKIPQDNISRHSDF